MKAKLEYIVAIVVSFCLCSSFVFSQENPNSQAQLLPEAATAVATPPPLEKLIIDNDDVISRRTLARPDQQFVIEEITPQKINAIPASISQVGLHEKENRITQNSQQSNRFTMFSCTVYRDDANNLICSHIKWMSHGKTPVEFYEAWSNIDFRHLTHLHTFIKAAKQHHVMFAVNYQSTAKMAQIARQMQREYTAPAIPSLPKNAVVQPTFILTHGSPSPEDLAVVEGLHELYKKHNKMFIEKYNEISAENARRAAAAVANPPDPNPDVTIRYWIPEQPISPDLSLQSANAKGGSK